VRSNPDLYVVPCHGRRGAQPDAGNPAPDFGPAYSPDGRWLAFSQRQIPGFYADRARLVLHDRSADNSQRVLTEEFDRSVSGLTWAPDSRTIYTDVDDAGHNRIYAIDARNGATRAITREHSFGNLALSRDGRVLVGLRQSFVEPPTLVRVDPRRGEVTKLSELQRRDAGRRSISVATRA
jgi:Tol biopolymer transport system component